MKEFTIIADAACDLTPELQERYGVRVAAAHVRLPDGTDMAAKPEWDRFTHEEFYAALKKDPDGFVTSPPNPAEYAAIFEEEAKAGRDILVFTISSAISGSLNFAKTAAEEVKAKFPGTGIICVDSLRYGPGFGLIVAMAAEEKKAGKTLGEVAEFVEKNKNRCHQAGWLDDLTFVAKKGRITHANAFFGRLAGVKPIGEFDYNGLTTVIGKAKGAKAAYEVLLKYVENTVEDPAGQVFFIAQTNRLPQAEEYKKMLEEKFRPREILILDVHPFCGVNVGPGLMAAYYLGKPISEGLTEERALIESFLNESK